MWSADTLMFNGVSYDAAYSGSTEIWRKEEPASGNYLTFTVVSGGTISWHHFTNWSNPKTIYYRHQGEDEWTALTSSVDATSSTITVEEGEVYEFKGTNATFQGTDVFKSSAMFDLSGNIMSLLYGNTNFDNRYTFDADQTFKLFFTECKVRDISQLVLPATALTQACYSGMFYGSSITGATPQLPATNLAAACYASMFSNTRITTPPALPATTLASQCYYRMFEQCYDLESAPALPATSLSWDCYRSMFNNCTSLTTAPALPATTLATNCYDGMFENTSITVAPALPATTLAASCYRQMFYMCVELTTGPELPATTLVDSCYRDMFNHCYKINYIKCLATDISATDCTLNWVDTVASAGTFVKASSTNWTTGVNGIPNNWTVEEV